MKESRIILAICFIVSFFIGCLVVSISKSAIHEILAAIIFLSSTGFLVGLLLIKEIEAAGVAILTELRKENK